MSKFAGPMKATTAAAKRKPAPAPSANLKIETGQRGRGRPRGGRSGDKERFQPLTVYIDRQVHLAAGQRLLAERRQFSDVIERLLQRWLEKPNLA